MCWNLEEDTLTQWNEEISEHDTFIFGVWNKNLNTCTFLHVHNVHVGLIGANKQLISYMALQSHTL